MQTISKNENHCKIKFIEVEAGDNSLDFHIASFVGFLLEKHKKANVYVISKDCGYDTVLKYWNNKVIGEVKRKEQIGIDVVVNVQENKKEDKVQKVKKQVNESKFVREIRDVLVENKYGKEERDKLINFIKKHEHYPYFCSSYFHNFFLMKEYDHKKCSEVSKLLRRIFRKHNKNVVKE